MGMNLDQDRFFASLRRLIDAIVERSPPPASLSGPTALRDADRLAMAATLWGEARGEGSAGQVAVAWVIVNRWRQPSWWSRERGDGIPDDTIEAVCRDPWQFTCWSDAQGDRLRAITLGWSGIAEILSLVDGVLAGRIPDPTGRADHYHTIAAPAYARAPGKWPPKWAVGRAPSARIGAHLFFALGPAGDGRQSFIEA
ncbi:cell wall hydrolase [Zavarzinia compransoris]|uniref:cell wall hydrolase n=1 Tax=Zavarzinia marina TaxID=2911065 RepID=UPI001F386338|nr:cell wall hydrolase [Zavarzinia marina]MCF4166321.1 cell wall hydrolase [Zavarzinia marina]